MGTDKMVKKVIFNGEQRSRRFSYDDQTVMIAEFLQEWCDRNNKLVLVSYDAEKEAKNVNYKLKLEIFGFKKIFTQTSGNISDALNQVSKQAINFLLSRFQLHPADLPPQLSPLFKRRGSAVN